MAQTSPIRLSTRYRWKKSECSRLSSKSQLVWAGSMNCEPLTGTVRSGEEDTIKLLTQLVREGKPVPYTIEVTFIDQRAKISGTIEP
jgi:hypothetical protein